MPPKKQSDHPIQAIYSLMVLTGSLEDPQDLVVPYEIGGSHLSIAIPKIKFGIAFDGDEVDDLKEAGWRIEHLAYSDVEPFARVFGAVDSGRLAKLYAQADPNIKNTSREEELLFEEFARRRLPTPDRNYKFTRDDGSELTTPDFTWVDHRVAFFMDGEYWHVIKSDTEVMKEIKKSKKMPDHIKAMRADKVRKDMEIRSELASRGWIIIGCTDEKLKTKEGLDQVVDMVTTSLKNSEMSRSVKPPEDDSTKSMVDDLLSGHS